MNAFAGFVALDGAPIASEAEASAARAVTALHAGRTVTRRVAGAAFVQRVASADAPFSGEAHLLTGADGCSLFAALARLDNREELAAELGLGGAELAQASDARLLRSMHERFGDDGVA